MLTLRGRQSEAAEFLGEELKHPRIGAVLALVEELGELVKEVVNADIYDGDMDTLRPKIADEASDVLFSLFEVCTAYGIDLETAYQSKLADLATRRPDWLEKYSANLAAKRNKLD